MSRVRSAFKRWLKRYLCPLLIGSILMLIAIVIGTAVAIVQDMH